MSAPPSASDTGALHSIDRRTLLATGAVLLGSALTGCGATRPEVPLRVSVTGRGQSDYRLLFKTAGIRPDFPISYHDFQSGHQVVEALNAGSLDIGGMSEIPPVFAAASAVQSFRQIAVNHGDVNNQAVVIPKGSEIRTLQDLKGKRVGYVRATTAHYFLVRMLQSVGLSFADIEPVAMTVSDGAAAFSRGSLDAWAIYGFPIQRAIATEGARVLRTALGFLSGNYLVSAHVSILADPVRSPWVAQYLGLLRRAFAWSEAHQEEWAGIVSREIGVPIAYMRQQFRERSAPFTLRTVSEDAIVSQQQVADVFTQQGMIPHAVKVRGMWDNRFNAAIEKDA